MAASTRSTTLSSSSSASSTPSRNQTNYIRLCRLLTDIGTKVLRGVLDALHPPADLQKHLNSPAVNATLKILRTKRVLNTQQWDKLYPTSGPPSSTTFDITLLFLLLRNTCGLTAPTTGWDALPSPADVSKEADLIRVKRCRNEITGHSTVAELSDSDFETHWAEIEAPLVRLGGKHFEPHIQRMKIDSVDPENEALLHVLLLSWEEGDEKKMDVIMEKLDKMTMSLPSRDYGGESDVQLNKQDKPNPFCNLPQKPSHDSIIRQREVFSVMDEIRRLRSTYPNQVTVTYLSGNPGCGKSELARQIGEAYFDCSDEDDVPKFVATLNASNLETLTQSYMELACQLRCNETSVTAIITSDMFAQDQKLAQLRGLVFPKVESFSSWLMIIDNVEDLQMISKFIPHAGQKLYHGKGHMLVTTQDSQSIPRSDPLAHHESLSNGMNPEDAVKSLCFISGCSDDSENAYSVAKKLDFQPLALACAAVYLRLARIAEPRVTWRKYLIDIENGNKESTERIFLKQSATYGKSMTTAVKMAVEKEIEKSKVMQHTFEFLAAMAPEFISLNHIINYVLMCMPDEDKTSIAAEIMTSSLVVTADVKSEQTLARVHQIVHYILQFVYQKMAHQSVNELSFFMKVIDVFSYLKGIDRNSVEYISAIIPLTGHFTSLSGKIKDYFEQNDILIRTEGNAYGVHYQTNKLFTHQYMPIAMFLINIVSGVFIEQKIYDICRMLLEISFAVIEKNDREQQLQTGQALSALGELWWRLVDNQKGRECYSRALVINERKYGDKHPVVAKPLSGLGKVLCNSGKYNEARNCHERALAINKATHGDDHPDVATNLSDLGNAFYYLGMYQSSKECQEKSLAIRRSIYGSNHPKLATTWNNLASVMRSLGNCQDAKECYEKALAINASLYGSDHLSSIRNLNNIGSVLTDLGHYKEAMECHQKSLEVKKRTFGKSHAQVGIDLQKLGTSLHGLGQRENAKECFQKSLEIIENTLGEDHPRVARTLNSLGRLQLEQGDTEEAKINLEKALVINEKSFTANHPEIANTLNNLGRLFQILDEYEQAKGYFERALVINEKVLDANHPQIAITLNNLGNLLIKLNEDKEGNQCLKRALAIKDKNPYFDYKF